MALIALALQLAVSFGHVHAPPGFEHERHAAVAPADPAAHSDHDDTSRDSDERHARLACDACTTLSLTGTIQAAPASLPALLAVATAPLPIAGKVAAERRHAHAQSRAPPTA